MTEEKLYKLLQRLGIKRLTRRRANIMGCCPNHKERNPSWGISISEPHLHACFACGFRGNLLTLLMRDGTFSRSEMRKIAGEPDRKTNWDEWIQASPSKPLDFRLLYPYKTTLRVYRYMEQRGISRETVNATKLLFDPINQRILFPWYIDKALVGVTGRAIRDDVEPRYLPYFETKKRNILYLPSGRFYAMPLIIVEGEIDALKVLSAGYLNVAALGFGSFTEQQRALVLKSMSSAVICFFDDDATGDRLTEQAYKHFEPYRQISTVDYSWVRPFYNYEKLDPGNLKPEDIKALIKRTATKFSWCEF